MERIVVPAGEGHAARVEAGRRFRIVDLEGSQVVDLFAFVAEEARRMTAPKKSRSWCFATN